jgi:Tubulin like
MSQTRESHKIQRTLCIGLGGTGRDVLMQIRRLIIDRYGKLDALPVVSFVHIDADKGAGNLSGLRTGSTYRGENILLTPAERVISTMKSQEIDELIRGLQKNGELDRNSPYEHIGRWLPPQLIRDVKAVEDGAGGVRPVGRLSFFHNYRKIKEVIQAAEDRTRRHERTLMERGLIVEPGLNIFVVGSLCGGTGSGMFLDVAYSLRQAYGDIENQLIGYWIVSPELYGNTPSMNANTYAALKELNHYAASNTRFRACYDPQQLVNIDSDRPPFDFTYILSNKTASDYKINDKDKLCNVIAHKIFLDFGDELTTVIKSQKDNFKDKLTRLDNHPRRNVQRYLTFGLAKIYVPQDRIIQIALNKIRQRLISFWVRGIGQNPDPQILLDRFLLKCGASATDRALPHRLQLIVTDNKKTFSQSLKTWSTKIEQEINAVKNATDRQQLLSQLASSCRAQFRKVQPGETDDIRGMWLTQSQKAMPELRSTLGQEVFNFLEELLSPSSQDFCLNNARSWLEAIITVINQEQRYLEEYLQARNGLFKTEDFDIKWSNGQLRLQDIEAQKGLFMTNGKKNQQFQSEAVQIFNDIKKLIQQNFDYHLHQMALEVNYSLGKFVRSLITESSQVNELLNSVHKTYQREIEDLERHNPDEITGEALFSPNDVELCYREFLPQKDEDSTLVVLSEQILSEEFSFEKSLVYLLIEITDREVTVDKSTIYYLVSSQIDENLMEKGIITTIDKRFAARKVVALEGVVERFLQKYPFANAEQRIQQILAEAKPLLPLTKDGYFYEDSGNKSEIIGFRQNDDRNSRQFEELLTEKVGIEKSVLKAVQSDTEITIVNEYAAFPLRLIQGIEKMREHYDRECKQNRARIHNDYQQIFSEVIPPDARRMKEMQDVFYTCLAFGILRKESDSYLYQSYDEFLDRHDSIELSLTWSEALEQISKASGICDGLKQDRDRTIENIKANSNLWISEYLPRLKALIKEVDDLSKEDPNYPERSIVLGEQATLERPATEGILRRLWNYLAEEVKRSQDNSINLQNMLPSQSQVNGEGDSTDADIVVETRYKV